MVFSSLPFLLLFLLVVLLVSHILPFKFRNFFLLLANLVFYAYGEPVYVLIMIGSILVNYFGGVLIEKQPTRTRKRVILILGIVIDLAALGVFKYAGLFVGTLKQIPAFSGLPDVSIALPIGISFYTFQSVSYVVDAYNGRFEPQGNFLKHLLFVSWFPQVIQGPINRYADLGPQLLEGHSAKGVPVRRSLLRFGYGALKKYAIANMLVGTIDKIFSNVTPDIPGSVVVFGILLYSAQQYGDFSGGIDMVEAASSLFGVDMAENFRRPYFSVSLADFWRRWHITLGTWMRDYVFFPFAVSRPMRALGARASRLGEHLGRTLPACVANLLVFLIVGLWHGAEPHYVAWGLYNGVVIALADLLAPAFRRANEALRVDTGSRAHRVLCVARTFLVVNVGWYFDRIYDFGDSLLCLRNTFTNFDAGAFLVTLNEDGLTMLDLQFLVFAAFACLIVFVVSLAQERGVDVSERILGWNCVARAALYFLVLGLIVITSFLTQNVAGGFMYANF